ncbi:MAG: hypothetical protein MI976_13745 [Pseudomonadales bacterium]|nr:hypothetical protein [Pseudomonadales bacterium]
MNDTLEQLDDLEIYVEGEPLPAIQQWLRNSFENGKVIRESKKGFRFDGLHLNSPTPITVVRNAGHTGYTSVWVKNRNTPWENDIEMARSAFQALATPVRCIESAWQKGDDPDLWYEISVDGEKQITWKTVDE